MNETDKKRNQVLVSHCPVCGRELVWLPVEPIKYPGADFVAMCIFCLREFGISAPK